MKTHALAVLLGATLLLPLMPSRMSGRAPERTPPAVDEQAALPDTPAGRCAADYFRAFNSGNEDAMRAFILKYRSPSYMQSNPLEKQMRFFRSIRQLSGDLVPQSHDSISDYDLVVTARLSRRLGGLATLRFKVENADAQRLLVFTIDYGGAGTGPVDAALIESTLDSLAGILERFYVSAQMGKEMADMLGRSKSSGRYAQIAEGPILAARLTADLRALSQDLHLGIFHGQLPKGGAPPRGEPGSETNYGFPEVKVVDGNIGYIKIDEFSPSERAREAAVEAMAEVADCQALIFDLRLNHGGGPELGHLISSYLFDAPTLLGSYYNRLEDGIKDIYTLESLPGTRFGQQKPVFILTSSNTASAAEAFAFCLQDLKRALIVGEKTVGTAQGARYMAVNDRFFMTMPIVRPISPVSKRNWEGTGVTPDIQVPEDQALDVAWRKAVKKTRTPGQISSLRLRMMMDDCAIFGPSRVPPGWRKWQTQGT